MDTVYRSVTRLALTTMSAMRWDVRTTGYGYIPPTGPAILASNHIGFLDFVFLGAGARLRGRLVRFMARHDAFEHWLGGPLLRAMKHIPVDREGEAGRAYVASLDALRAGEVVGIHPEGTISRSLIPQPAKTGAARLAIASGAPLIPSVVWGSHRIMARGHQRFPRNVVITVDFAEPMRPEPGEGAAGLTDRLMQRIRALADRAMTHYPQKPRNEEDRWWVPRHLGGTAPTVEESLAMVRAEAERRRARRGLPIGDSPPVGDSPPLSRPDSI